MNKKRTIACWSHLLMTYSSEKIPWNFHTSLRSHLKNSCFGFHQAFQTPRNNKSTRKRPRVFICFSVFGTPDKTLALVVDILLLKLINYSCCSYPTRAFYSGQVDEFRSPMKNELKTRPCLNPCLKLFETRMQIFLICILIKQQKHVAINNYLITHFTKQTLNLNYLLLTLNVTVQLLNYPKQKSPFFF